MNFSSNHISAVTSFGLILIFLGFTLITYLVSEHIFFWDTVQLASRHAHFFYENNFMEIFLPDEIDSGHIPSFGIYLALAWKLFEKSLFVSHFAMLPFLYGIILQTYLLIKKYFPPKLSLPVLILVLADPTFLSQSILVSPDIPLIFFFLLGLNSVLNRNRKFISIAVLGLILISNRGVFLSATIFLMDIIFNMNYAQLKPAVIQIMKRCLLYLPAFLIFIVYNILHFKAKGWIGYHEESPWAQSFVLVEWKDLFFNSGILVWRLVDFGRIFLWITGLLLIIKFFRNNIKDQNFKKLGIFLILSLIVLSIPLLAYKSLSGHRYLLPVYLIFSLLTAYLILNKIKSQRLKYVLYTISLVGLLTGNLWIYPEKISQGWDSSLAHLPYYGLFEKMQMYLDQENIEITQVGCTFPNLAEQRYLKLNDDHRSFRPKSIETDQYVLYSNVYNDFEDYEIDLLNTNFILHKEFRKRGVFIKLFEKKAGE